MEVFVRKFDKKDIRDAILIWNQVVEDGVLSPQTELLDESSGMRSLKSRPSPALPARQVRTKLWDFIFSIPIM